MWFQHGGDSNLKNHSWKGTGQNRTRKDQDSKEIENSNEDQGCGKFPWICKFLQMLYPELQPHSKAIKWTKGQERWKWNKDHQQAFEELKNKITS